MKLTRSLLTILAVCMWISGCGGATWENRVVSGSTGPVWEIRSARSSRAVQSVPQQALTEVDPQARQIRLQEQLLKQSAMVSQGNSGDYRVGPEDLLQVGFLDAEKLSSEVRVDGEGRIRLLLVGDVEVSGLTPVEIARKLTRLYREGDYLRNPQIAVAVKEYRHQKVAVTGAVNKPDHYALIGPRTLLEVLGMAGGLSEKAGESVHVIRPQNGAPASSAESLEPSASSGAQTVVVDLNQLLLKGATELNVPVRNGDVVFVPFAQTAFVLGAVAKPGGVLLQDNMTVTKAISQTGGLHIVLSSYHATILRVDEDGRRSTLPVDLGRITGGKQEDVALKANDIVYVHESPTRRFLFDIKMFLPGSVGLNPAAL